MTSPFSKLRKSVCNLFDPNLDLDIHAAAYRNPACTSRTATPPNYRITLGREEIWRTDNATDQRRWLSPVAEQIFGAYLNVPREELLNWSHPKDRWGLAEVLKAADRRLSPRRLARDARIRDNPAAMRILEARQKTGDGYHETNRSL